MATAKLYITSQQAIIHCTVTGVNFPSVYSWTSIEGGDIEGTPLFTRTGGMLPGFVIPTGINTRGDVTVKRQYTADLHPYLVPLENACNRAASSLSWTMLDYNGNATGASYQRKGVLKAVQAPKFDSEGTATTQFLGLVIMLDEQATTSS